ncbi:acyl-CoA thioester hydrolase/BAAT C-terminal domain-containing protein [Flavihumibacter sp. UBA7668]|uniref:acyl-CoA thioester hydrolase/BAAT C-terminal domain-containing protein n=1 Tax=Flavihumibacter sp. UBA7668 TaxID=1946542 RepID=UPI0025C0F266|nr:acyl-CoA thioester hydrolase/BAAT C-terminal domain-containing protein [Flavihumibacter sp. UBA7668]
MRNLLIILFSIFLYSSNTGYSQDTLNTPNVQAILYKGIGNKQPLVVGFGGSEGRNAWASRYWQKTREEFIQKGYAFLAVGYFGSKGTPAILDKIALDEVYNAISAAKQHPLIDGNKIALIGGSRGADLALLIGTYYSDISCVIAMSASHAVFPGHTQDFTSSCWTYKGKELPFVPVNEAAIPFMMKQDLRSSFEAMLMDSIAEKKALIQVEKINGPILLMAATRDEIIPAVEMGKKMAARLKSYHFKHSYELAIYEGTHVEPTRHFDKIFSFLAEHFFSDIKKLMVGNKN